MPNQASNQLSLKLVVDEKLVVIVSLLSPAKSSAEARLGSSGN